MCDGGFRGPNYLVKQISNFLLISGSAKTAVSSMLFRLDGILTLFFDQDCKSVIVRNCLETISKTSALCVCCCAAFLE